MAVMFDKDFFKWLEDNDITKTTNLLKMVIRSVELKAEVVSQDEKEHGIRAVLNYGHTFGHVIEKETKYKKYLHGECVGIGMCMANALAVKLDLLTEKEAIRVENLLSKYDIPTSYDIPNKEEFYESFFLDKKSTDSKIKFILPVGIGGNVIRDDILKDEVVSIL
jgi:3-dehydroquinate synthase